MRDDVATPHPTTGEPPVLVGAQSRPGPSFARKPSERFASAEHALEYLATPDPAHRAEAVEVVRRALEARR